MPLVEPRGAPRPAVLRLVASAWALLFPSCWEEPMPYVVYEALLMRVPVVAFPIGGQAELIKMASLEFLLPNEMSAEKFIWSALQVTMFSFTDMIKIKNILANFANKDMNSHSCLRNVFKNVTKKSI
jgi:hypothetical protein